MEYLIPIVTAGSSILILYSTFKLNQGLNKGSKLSPKEKEALMSDHRYYLMRVKELEYRREMIRDAILNIVKEFEAGNIDEKTKDALLVKFREELDKIEAELSSISKYAELEKLEKEYMDLVNEFEKRKSQLEKRINELRNSLQVKEKIMEEKPKKEVKKSEKKEESKEESLEDLMEEISKFMKELGEESG